MYRFVVFGVLALLGGAHGHTYHLGACPVVEPMPGFDMDNMLGIWYVVQKTSTASHCITYNFTKSDEPAEYMVEQISQHFILGLTPLEHDYRYSGILTVPDTAVPARMIVRFPLSLAGSASYTVMATDYTQYAAVFTCQKLVFAHRRSATILSRTKELGKTYLDKMRTRLSSFGVDPYDLSIISQKACPKHPNGTTVNIDISKQSIGNALTKTGETIADGVGYVVETGKKIYNKVTAESKEDLTEPPAADGKRNMNADAEWLP